MMNIQNQNENVNTFESRLRKPKFALNGLRSPSLVQVPIVNKNKPYARAVKTGKPVQRSPLSNISVNKKANGNTNTNSKLRFGASLSPIKFVVKNQQTQQTQLPQSTTVTTQLPRTPTNPTRQASRIPVSPSLLSPFKAKTTTTSTLPKSHIAAAQEKQIQHETVADVVEVDLNSASPEQQQQQQQQQPMQAEMGANNLSSCSQDADDEHDSSDSSPNDISTSFSAPSTSFAQLAAELNRSLSEASQNQDSRVLVNELVQGHGKLQSPSIVSPTALLKEQQANNPALTSPKALVRMVASSFTDEWSDHSMEMPEDEGQNLKMMLANMGHMADSPLRPHSSTSTSTATVTAANHSPVPSNENNQNHNRNHSQCPPPPKSSPYIPTLSGLSDPLSSLALYDCESMGGSLVMSPKLTKVSLMNMNGSTVDSIPWSPSHSSRSLRSDPSQQNQTINNLLNALKGQKEDVSGCGEQETPEHDVKDSVGDDQSEIELMSHRKNTDTSEQGQVEAEDSPGVVNETDMTVAAPKVYIYIL